MRIGIVANSWRASGGSFQHTLMFLEMLREVPSNDEFVVFHAPVTDLPLSQIRAWSFATVGSTLLDHGSLLNAGISWGINSISVMLGDGPAGRVWRQFRRLASRARRQPWSGDIDTVVHRSWLWHRLFRRHRIELMIYLGVAESCFETGIPYVLTVLDLFHCFHPEFPEAFVHGEPESYEYVYRNATRHATLILVDSEVGKADVLECYGRHGAPADRIKVLPHLPPPYLPDSVSADERQRVARKYGLPTRYLLYPARFWRHKNHARILEALHLLKTRDRLTIPLVLVGFDTSEHPQEGELSVHDVRALSDRWGLQEQVRYLGVVPDDDMAGLYAAATALIMPTLFGPTTLPVLEAWQLGCPVITSDISGIREHAGDAALLVAPYSVEAIAEGIRQVWTDEGLRRELAQRGRDRMASYTRRHYIERLTEILEEAKARAIARTP